MLVPKKTNICCRKNVYCHLKNLLFFRFTCTVQNGFGVDMISTFLYPLAPSFPDIA